MTLGSGLVITAMIFVSAYLTVTDKGEPFLAWMFTAMLAWTL